jgi:predicted DNA-binding antitoxin AbrB/MazE fold protein
VDAIFQDGVFRPVSPPELREGERVRLTVERAAQATPEDVLRLARRVYEGLSEEDVAEVEAVAREATLSRLGAGIERMNFCSSGPLPSRDESHDRPWQGMATGPLEPRPGTAWAGASA